MRYDIILLWQFNLATSRTSMYKVYYQDLAIGTFKGERALNFVMFYLIDFINNIILSKKQQLQIYIIN